MERLTRRNLLGPPARLLAVPLSPLQRSRMPAKILRPHLIPSWHSPPDGKPSTTRRAPWWPQTRTIRVSAIFGLPSPRSSTRW